MRKTLLLLCVASALAVAGVDAYRKWTAPPPPPRIIQATVTRGDLFATVTATGPIDAVRTVTIGSQVTGVITKLYVDYNSIVKKDQVVAEIDPTLEQQQLDSAQAALDRARIDLAEEKIVLANDQRNLERTNALVGHDLDTQQDRELAALAVEQDKAVIAEDDQTVTSSITSVDEAKTNLSHCTITSPIDGVVVSRALDEGATVQASIVAPTLFVLATNLTTLLIEGDVDESDVGQVRPGDDVAISVDAYPTSTFHGSVAQVRLNTATINNVVTYQAMISVPNPDYRLRPGMTATLKINTAQVRNVLRVPNTAVRFRTVPDMFTALKQPVPAWVAASAAAPPQTPPPAHMSPAALATSRRQGNTIDALEGPPLHPDDVKEVWTMDNGRLVDVPLHLGVTDGVWTEVISGNVHEGESLVTGVFLPLLVRKPGAQVPTNPMMPSRGGFGGRGF